MLAAAVPGQADILQMLLDHGADCTDRDKNGNTALIHATIAGCSDNANFLIQFMKNNTDLLNVQNNSGITALMCDLLHCGSNIASELIDNGADVNITDMNGNTALFLAISSVSPDSVLVNLIRAGCNVNHHNNAGLSPLMQAVRRRNYKGAISLIRDLGADVNAVNHTDSSKTALSYFKLNLDTEAISCSEALLDREANAAYVSPFFLCTIMYGPSYKLIPKLIRCGLTPFDSNFDEVQMWLTAVLELSSVSPLCLALLTENAALVRYFWEHLFLTDLDLSLASNNNVRQFFEETEREESLSVLDEIGSQPMPLFRMCFVAVSSAVGTSPGRETRVHQLPLPSLLKDMLLFKSEVVILTQPQGDDITVDAFHFDSFDEYFLDECLEDDKYITGEKYSD